MKRTISPNEFYDRKEIVRSSLESLLCSDFFEKMMATRGMFVIDIATILDFLLNGIKNKKILDVGCGGGDKCENGDNFAIPYLSISLSTLGANVVGIDLYAKPNQYYRKFEAYKMAAEEIDKKFREGEFDAIVALEFWNSPARLGRIDRISDNLLGRINGNHRQKLQLEKDEEQLRKLYKVLREGGIYIDGLGYCGGKIDKSIFRKIGFENLSSYFIKDEYSNLDWYTIGRKPQKSN